MLSHDNDFDSILLFIFHRYFERENVLNQDLLQAAIKCPTTGTTTLRKLLHSIDLLRLACDEESDFDLPVLSIQSKFPFIHPHPRLKHSKRKGYGRIRKSSHFSLVDPFIGMNFSGFRTIRLCCVCEPLKGVKGLKVASALRSQTPNQIVQLKERADVRRTFGLP